MSTTLEVLFAPAEYASLNQHDLRQTVCVVFDVLRATSTMVAALDNGAAAIVPVADIAEALDLRRREPDVLLAGERNGLRIQGDLTGGIEFDLGNSPREFTRARVEGRTIVMTTTNGTRALGLVPQLKVCCWVRSLTCALPPSSSSNKLLFICFWSAAAQWTRPPVKMSSGRERCATGFGLSTAEGWWRIRRSSPAGYFTSRRTTSGQRSRRRAMADA
jgi:hypothetical protein